MADDTRPQLSIEFVADDGSVTQAFSSIGKEAAKEGEKAGKSFSDKFRSFLSGGTFPLFTELNSALSLAEKGFRALGNTIQSVVNQSLIAEDIAKINKQFDILISQSGNSAAGIRRGLEAATGGVVDFEDALKAAAQASIRLGEQSDRIPELFELARKAAATFGGDSISVFNDLANAVQNSNGKILRLSTGIRVDFTEAQKSYAKEVLGVTRALTEQEKTQANVNTLLLKATETYKNISVTTGTVTESYNKLKVSTDDFFENFAIAVNNVFGPSIKFAIDGLNSLVSGFNKLLSGPSYEEKIVSLTGKLKEFLDLQQRGISSSSSSQELFIFGNLRNEIEKTRAEIDKLVQQNLNDQSKLVVIQSEAEKANAIKQTTEAIKLQAEADKDKTRVVLDNQQAIAKGFTDGNEDFEAYQKSLLSSFKSLTNGSQIFSTALSAGLAAVGKSLVNGTNSFKEFGKAIIGVLGGILVQVGSAVIALGVAGTVVPFLGISGAAAIAAGAGLVVLGSALQALGQGSKGANDTGGTVTATSGAGIGGPALVTEDVNQDVQNLRPQGPETVINVNVGNLVTDNDETGLRLVEIINSAFDRQGLTIRQGAIV